MAWESLIEVPLITRPDMEEDLESVLLIADLIVRQVFLMSDWNLVSSAS
jgi:hypothetical protein